ncbi:MAG: GNAT family N-acetyltransferase [Planctomycetales bacterium]|nr:GNAT family N-acetyltransferase [Planctomycetales bacterium]
MILQTDRLTLVLNSVNDVREMIERLSDEDRAEVSPLWLEKALAATEPDPWLLGFKVTLREEGTSIGDAGFKGPPSDNGVVEIAYGIEPDHQSHGFATEAARALIAFARQTAGVRVVRAHTRHEGLASARVLAKCGFRFVGDVIDPEDGLVQRWEMDA